MVQVTNAVPGLPLATQAARQQTGFIADLPPNIFSIVMATGIVSIAALGNGWRLMAMLLFYLNIILSVALGLLIALRCMHYPSRVLADYSSHAKAPGFLTLVAGTCVLGNQFVLVAGWPAVGIALWLVGLALWLLLSYTLLPVLISVEKKPPLEQSLSGTWLLAVVATQAVSVLGSIVGTALPEDWQSPAGFVALSFWLVGGMLYVWLMSLIFYRLVFLPLSPAEFTPPYWINMGAMAISTLAGLWLIRSASYLALASALLPFLKGMTLLFWATATWWIPLLLAAGVWRHGLRRVPLVYEHGYWAAVFPLGMYTVCTQRLITTLDLPFLQPLAAGFAWVSAGAWMVVFIALLRELLPRNQKH